MICWFICCSRKVLLLRFLSEVCWCWIKFVSRYLMLWFLMLVCWILVVLNCVVSYWCFIWCYLYCFWWFEVKRLIVCLGWKLVLMIMWLNCFYFVKCVSGCVFYCVGWRSFRCCFLLFVLDILNWMNLWCRLVGLICY